MTYTSLNYQGTAFAGAQNVTSYEYLHVDYYTTNSTALNFFLIGNGETSVALDVTNTGVWNSVNIPLSDYAGAVNLSNVIQFKVDGNGDVVFDNLYFGGAAAVVSGCTNPEASNFDSSANEDDGSCIVVTMPASPVPTEDAATVLSVFSDAYTNLEGTDFNPGWGQATQVTQGDILTYKNLNYQGTQFANQNVSAYSYLHVDYYVTESTGLNFFLIGGGETAVALDVTATEQWVSVEIPLTDFTAVNLADVFQFKVDGNGEVSFDNLYFGGKQAAVTGCTNSAASNYDAAANEDDGSCIVATVPDAPVPTEDAASVLSIFGATYGNLEGTDFNPGWGQATTVEVSDVLTYTGLNYQGTVFAAQDVSGYGYIHVDYYTTNATALNFFLIGDGETPVALDVTNTGVWNSVDIPLSDYASVVNLANVHQFKVDGNGDVIFGNLYFGGTPPTVSGCTDATALNYNAAATESDDSCTYPDPCADLVYHFNIKAEAASAMYLKVQRTGANTVDVSAVSATNDPMDLLAIHALPAGAEVSETVIVDGTATVTLTWADVAPATSTFEVHWSKVTMGGNWLLRTGDQPEINTANACGEALKGCTDAAATNYWAAATEDDGSCQLPVSGCTDSAATNYDAAATVDDGSCVIAAMPASPVPTEDAGTVLSIFSDAYTNVEGTDFNPNWGQATQVTVDSVLTYTSLNYQGTAFAGAQNVTSYEYLHVDYYTTNSTALNFFLIGNGETSVALDVTNTGVWNSVNIPLSDYAGAVNLSNVIQFKVDGNGDVVFDNLYFGGAAAVVSGCTNPEASNFDSSANEDDGSCIVVTIPASPVPTEDAATVLSVFSDAYTNLEGTDFNPGWGQATQVTQGDILTYKNLNYQGTQFANQNVSAYSYLHVDYYVTESTGLNFFLIGGGETAVALDVTATEQWVSVEIPLTDFTAVNLADVFQFKVDGNGEVSFDNLYFGGKQAAVTGCTNSAASNYDAAATEDDGSCQLPVSGCTDSAATNYDAAATVDDGSCVIAAMPASPVPTEDAGTVLSIFSDAYTNLEGTDFNPNWGQATQVTVDSVLTYTSLNYQGTAFAGAQNVTSYEYLHVDYYTTNSTALNFFLIGNGETSVALDVTNTGVWNSVNIPLSDYAGAVNLSNVIQFKVDGNGDVVFDNLYFGGAAAVVSGCTNPEASNFDSSANEDDGSCIVVTIPASPVPTEDAATVLSVFSDAYTNLEGTDFNPGWGQATQVTQGDILTYKNLNYQGTQFANQNVSAYSYLHVDYYVTESTGLNFFLIGGGETAVALDVTATEQWVSVEIPLTDFTAVNLADVFQFKVDGNGEVSFDNLYFGGKQAAVTGCTDSAATNYDAAATVDDGSCVIAAMPASPVPTEDAGTVLSIFSDAYTNVEGTDFNPNWGQATQVTVDSVLTYTSLNYQGTAFAGAQNVTSYEYLHVDYYTTNSTALNFFLIGNGETSVALDVTNTGVWNSVNIPLSDYAGAVNLSNVIQFKVDGNGDVVFDNLYFGGAAAVVSGCTNPEASNFDSSANEDDGSCQIEGCTATLALNHWDADANVDDGSCEYSQAYVDSLIAAATGGTPVDSASIADAAYADGVASVDITTDNAAAYADGVASVTPDDGVTQADVDAAVAAVDITTDNAAAYADGVASVTPDDGVSQADVDAAVAAVDITTDNAAAYADGVASVTPDDGVTQADVDAAVAAVDITTDNSAAYADGVASVTPDDGVSQADVDAAVAAVDITTDNSAAYADGVASVTPDDGVTQADVDAAVAAVDITTDNAAAYADGVASVTPEDGVSQADVDAAVAAVDITTDNAAAYADGVASVTPEDGVSQADVDEVQVLLDAALANSGGSGGGSCDPIYVDIVAGWNILGYTLSYGQDVAATVADIVDDIEIVKNNDAKVYWPEFGFNGIGDFVPGQGYQIKTKAAISNYTWPDVSGQRVEMTPTVPAWAFEMDAELHPNDIRSLVKVVNMLGQEVNAKDQFTGEVLLHLYNDGTVEKRIVK